MAITFPQVVSLCLKRCSRIPVPTRECGISLKSPEYFLASATTLSRPFSTT
uniref:Uncharacterized protein n=1 Tax=Lepeophtheirus salmonis TaxID=72036 RepID=A0A0K2TX28_LEPSM